MRFSSDYSKFGIHEALEKHQAFYATHQSYFDQKKQDGVNYVQLSDDIHVPAENAASLVVDIELAKKLGREQDVKENGIDRIIHRELENFDCQISVSYKDALPTLLEYGVTEDKVKEEFREFFKYCVETDSF